MSDDKDKRAKPAGDSQPPDPTDAKRKAAAGSQDQPVGYRRPPAHSRYKPGQSGNPSGRPRRPRALPDLGELLQQALADLVPVIESGRQRRLSLARVLTRKLVTAAASGDQRAVANLLRAAKLYPGPTREADTAVDPIDYGAEVRARLDRMAANLAADRDNEAEAAKDVPLADGKKDAA